MPASTSGDGRPGGGHQQCGDLVVGRVARQRLAEVVEVAVQVDVLVRGAAPPREAVGVERVHVEHGHAGLARPRRESRRRPSSAICTPEPQKPSTPWQALLTMQQAPARRRRRRAPRPSPASRRRGRAAGARCDCTSSAGRARPRPGTCRAPRRSSARRSRTRSIAPCAFSRSPAARRRRPATASARRTQAVAPSGISSSLKS